MADITIKTGDLLASEKQTLVNTVNCRGIMGKGIALAFREKYPDMFKDYARRCERSEVRLGMPYLYKDQLSLIPEVKQIVNFPTKDHWRSSSNINDIECGLKQLESNCEQWGITSIAMPALGCGNGHLHWREVAPLILQSLEKMDIDAELYAPDGTPQEELTREFLEGH